MAATMALADKPELLTAAFARGDPKPRLDRYRSSRSPPRRSAGCCGCRARARPRAGRSPSAPASPRSGAALVVIVVLLRRWVLQPLARLAADAERIAGGELDVEPLPTRAREVAQVGDALHGMARGLSDALRHLDRGRA